MLNDFTMMYPCHDGEFVWNLKYYMRFLFFFSFLETQLMQVILRYGPVPVYTSE